MSELPDLDKFFPNGLPGGQSSEYPSEVGEVVAPMGEAVKADAAVDPRVAELPAVTKEEKAPEPPKQFESIAEAIKRTRVEREARTAAEAREKELKTKLEAKASEPEFRKDPFTYIKGHRLSPQEQVELGRALIYDVVPDKAPPDMRFKLYEARMEREKAEEAKAREEAETTRQAQATQQANQASFNNFVETMVQTSKSLDPAKYPQLADWFGDDTETLSRSMISTGTNLATLASQQGTRADLSPAAIMTALETEVAHRLTARDQRVAVRTKQSRPQGSNSGTQATGKTLSTSGMNTGSPRPPALSEAERVARAAEAMFKR